jgi:hypothetical protein
MLNIVFISTKNETNLPTELIQKIVLSRHLLNQYGEIGCGYLDMSMMVIGLSLPLLRQRWRCLLYDVY